mgnify:FL=1|tara:strand:- start:906 stop:2159 length:1254 start_codon:yes stop_codon:yes gene_type:complete
MPNLTKLNEFDYTNKTVLLRVDINSPIDKHTKIIVNENRIIKSIPTIKKLLDSGAKLAIIAHQGDTLDYQNLIPLHEHAKKLSFHSGYTINYVDDVAGPEAQKKIKSLQSGEAILLGNLRYLSEEISTFENSVKLKPQEMLDTYLVRGLAPLVDYYVNDAFAAAHRNSPSMVAFPELKPTAAGELLYNEVATLEKVMHKPVRPSVFILGGAKISDAFGMMEKVLADGSVDNILTCGVTGEIMLKAAGFQLGRKKEEYLNDKQLNVFVSDSKKYLKKYREKIHIPLDLAFSVHGERKEILIEDLPAEHMYKDIGSLTIEKYKSIISKAQTVFVNGPPGVYEEPEFEKGTRAIWEYIASAKGFSVMGGGDTVAAAIKFKNDEAIDYICTAGGAMVQYLSGKKLPLIQALEKASKQYNST